MTYTGEDKTKKELPFILFQNNKSSSLNYDISNGDYRLVVVESEYRFEGTKPSVVDLTSLLELKNNRIVMVNLFELNL